MPASTTRRSKKERPVWAEAIRLRRLQLDLKQEDVEALSGDLITQSSVSNIEMGKLNPSTITASRLGGLLQALRWTPQEFTDATGIDLPGFIIIASGTSSILPQDSGGTGQFIHEHPGDRLERIRLDKDLTPEHAAELTGGVVSARRLRNLEEREGVWQRVKEEEATALARAYGMSVMSFLNTVNGTPYPAKPNIYTDEATLQASSISGRRRIPVIDLLSAGPGGDGGNIVGYIDLEDEFQGPHSAYLITGDSMEPEIRDGETVIVRCQDYAPPKNNIVCWTPDDGMLCKYLDRVEDGFYVLTSLNPLYKPIWTREIHIYGIVVQSRKPFKVSNGNHN